MKKYHYLYELRLKSDPRYYYRGKHSTENLNDGYLGSGSEVKHLVREQGSDCFTKTIFKFCSSLQEVLQEEEKYVGDLWTEDPFCLNLTPGGAFSGKLDMTGVPKSFETRKKLRDSHLGLKRSKETRQRISESKKGRKLNISPEIQERLSKLRSRPRPESVRIAVSKAQKGRPKTAEHVQKMKECKVGRIWINNGTISKMLTPEKAKEFLELGWQRGRLPGQGRQVGVKLAYIHKGKDRKQVSFETLQVYLDNGWKRGSGTNG